MQLVLIIETRLTSRNISTKDAWGRYRVEMIEWAARSRDELQYTLTDWKVVLWSIDWG